MAEENPYAPPGAELVESAALSLPGLRADHLRLLGWLSLAHFVGTLLELALGMVGGFYDLIALQRAGDWLSTLSVLLGAYVLLRLKALLVARFAVMGLDWPVYLTIAFSILAQVVTLGFDDQLETLGLPMLALFVVLALLGGSTLWLGIRLFSIRQGDGLLRTLAWLYAVSGGMLVSIILILLALLPMLAAQFVVMLIFFRAARETR